MNIALEEAGGRVAAVRETEVEPFSQKMFGEVCQESFIKGVPHVIGRVEVKDGKDHTYYDGRQLCKFLFELVISKDGRKVRMKNTLNPADDKKIKEVAFFEVLPSDVRKGVFIGTHKDFLESSKFRSRIFNRNDPFDSLSINFVFKDAHPLKIRRGVLVSLLLLLAVLCGIFTGCVINLLRNTKLISPPVHK